LANVTLTLQFAQCSGEVTLTDAAGRRMWNRNEHTSQRKGTQPNKPQKKSRGPLENAEWMDLDWQFRQTIASRGDLSITRRNDRKPDHNSMARATQATIVTIAAMISSGWVET